MPESFPLQWPSGWKRTALSARRSAPYKVTAEKATAEMFQALVKLGADQRSIVISSNVPMRRDGMPKVSTQPSDPGVAVYWTTRAHGERVIACDRWQTVRENTRAIGLAIEALRSIERAGATQILERAFTAFGALPPAEHVPASRPWWEVFGFQENMVGLLSMPVVDARYRELAAKYHPDKLNGSAAAFLEIGQAREMAAKHYGAT